MRACVCMCSSSSSSMTACVFVWTHARVCSGVSAYVHVMRVRVYVHAREAGGRAGGWRGGGIKG